MALQLSFRLSNGEHVLPLARVYSIAGYATLIGERDEYFLGWLCFHGEWVPVFDLNRVVNDQPTPETFGTRIILLPADTGATVRLVGLLAAGVTDAVEAGNPNAAVFNLDSCLPVIMSMIPEVPAVTE